MRAPGWYRYSFRFFPYTHAETVRTVISCAISPYDNDFCYDRYACCYSNPHERFMGCTLSTLIRSPIIDRSKGESKRARTDGWNANKGRNSALSIQKNQPSNHTVLQNSPIICLVILCPKLKLCRLGGKRFRGANHDTPVCPCLRSTASRKNPRPPCVDSASVPLSEFATPRVCSTVHMHPVVFFKIY